MATRRARKSTAWGEVALFGFFGLLVLAGLSTAGLYFVGFFDAAQGPSREGQLACPALARPVDAYSAITRNDLINPQTGQLNIVWLPEETAERVLRDLTKIIGRVAKRDKSASMALTESDFFPPGTRPGLAAGIPPGMKAVSIETSRIDGLSLLRMGDRFDLVASLPADADAVPTTEYAVLLGGIKPPDTRAGQLAKQTGVRTLVRDGQMIALTRGKARSTEGEQELVVDANRRNRDTSAIVATIGVSPVEVTPLTEALGLDTKIVCVTHSGRGDETAPNRADEVDVSGMTPVVAPFRGVKAYTAIAQHDLVDPVSGRVNQYYFDPPKLKREWLTDFSQLVGRVPRRDIGPGEPISEADLLPIGARPGLAAAAPPGTVVVEVSADRLNGAQALSTGDTVAVYRQLPDKLHPAFPTTEWATIYGGQLSPDDERLRQTIVSGVQLISDDIVLMAVTLNDATEEDDDVANRPQISRLVLAVPQESVIAINQALFGEEVLTVTVSAEEPRRAVLPFDGDHPQRPVQFAGPQAGKVAVPVLARPVEPFHQLTEEDFIDPTTGRVRVFYFPADQVKPEWVTSIQKLVDRVAGEAMKPGRVVRAGQLVQAGARPGAGAGVPEGYTAIEVNSFQIDGLDVPKVLDHIDLVAARPLHSVYPEARSRWANEFEPEVFYAPQAADVFHRADNRTLTSDAILLKKELREFEFERTQTSETAADEVELADGTATRRGVTRTTEPVVIKKKGLACTLAVPNESIPLVLEALSVQRLEQDGADGEGDGNEGRGSRSASVGSVTEVLIYAVTHSSRPSVDGPKIEQIDVIDQWIRRWSNQFRKFRNAAACSPVETVEQIRGASRSQAVYYDGVAVTPEEADRRVYGDTLESVLPGQAR